MSKLRNINKKDFYEVNSSSLDNSKNVDLRERYHMSQQLYERFGFVLNPQKDFNYDELDIDHEFRQVMSCKRHEFLEAALASDVFSKHGKYKLLININSY